MKKAFWFIAAAMLIFASCSKDPKKPNKPTGDDEGEELILIDGEFADWAAAPKVLTVNRSAEYVGETISEDNQRIDAVKTMKVVADQYNIYFYFEVDMSIMFKGGAPKWDGNKAVDGYAAHLSIYVNTDNDPLTGGKEWEFAEQGYEYYYEFADVFSRDASAVGEMAGGSMLKFTGEDGAELWASGDASQEEVTGEGLFAGWGKKDGDIIKYEVSLTRSFLNIPGKKVSVGAIVYQDADWMLMSALPQANSGVEGSWTGKLLEVELP